MRQYLVITFACLLMLGGVLAAEDIQPPWWRGEYSTTSQVWEFLTPLNPALPDGPAPGGKPPLPSTHVYVTPGPPPWDQWMSYYDGREGVWPLSGRMDVMVDNHEPPNLFKWVWVQLTWSPQESGARPHITGLDPAGVAPPQVILEEPLPGSWTETTYFWEIRPNPAYERFVISGSINVDELVIDTWCIPEPMTLALLGLGGLAVLRRRR